MKKIYKPRLATKRLCIDNTKKVMCTDGLSLKLKMLQPREPTFPFQCIIIGGRSVQKER